MLDLLGFLLLLSAVAYTFDPFTRGQVNRTVRRSAREGVRRYRAWCVAPLASDRALRARFDRDTRHLT